MGFDPWHLGCIDRIWCRLAFWWVFLFRGEFWGLVAFVVLVLFLVAQLWSFSIYVLGGLVGWFGDLVFGLLYL